MKLFLLILCLLLIIPSAGAFGKNKQETVNYADLEQREYTFDDNIVRGRVVKLKKGTTIPIVLQTPLDTTTSQKGDEVEAILYEDLELEGIKIAEKGSILYGKIKKAKSASNCMRGGKIIVNFDKIITTENKTYNISTKNIKFVVSEEDKWLQIGKSLLEIVAAAAYVFISGGGGAIVLLVYMIQAPQTGFSLFDKRGEDAIIPATTLLETHLNSSLKATVIY